MTPDVFTPATKDEVVEHVRAATRDGTPLILTGSATRPSHARSGARVLSTHRLDRIVAHEAGDLTLTAESGVTIAMAQRTLAAHRQFVALDAEDPDATLGGVIAAGRDGPLAARFGSVRDQVLGIEVVNGDGKVTKAGGRVVKNVTGYDLCRLYAGSRGGLGIILEVTLRVRPIAERARRVEIRCAGEPEAFEAAMAIRDAVPEAASIQVTADGGNGALVHVIVAGLPAFVLAASTEVRGAAGGAGAVSEAACDPIDFNVALPPEECTLVEIAALPASWRALRAEVAPLLTPPRRIVHDVLRGVRASWHAAASTPFLDERRLDGILGRAGAVVDLPHDPLFPASLARRFPGQTPSGLELMKSLKAALDPVAILNRGMTIYG